MFIAFEGLDGSGGTTQLARLAASWRGREPGREVVYTREPSPGPVGRLIREVLAGNEVGEPVLPYLFATDRRDHLDRVVLPALSRGAAVLSDRYALSSFAYQSLAVGLDRVMSINADFPAPDLTLMIDLPPEACLARIEARGGLKERFETLERLREIGAAYEAAIACARWRVARIDGNGTPDAVHARIVEAVWPR